MIVNIIGIMNKELIIRFVHKINIVQIIMIITDKIQNI